MDGIRANDDERQSVEVVKRTRRRWTPSEKRQIVRETHRPGAVKQEVARRHGVNASVLNRWCTEERRGSSGKKTAVSAARLVPVRVRRSRTRRVLSPPASATTAGASQPGAIEVEFSSGQRVTVRGVVDAGALRTVLEELAR